MDLSIALCGLLFLAPILAAVALAILVFDGRPVLFQQMRPGLGERPFRLLKFRTMTTSGLGSLRDSQRLTRVGGVLRRFSLDELPQLWNVLVGDMSLVGPRPLFASYLSVYTERERLRHTVRPGLTGLAQINGRSRANWDDRLALDVEYATSCSFSLDAKILLRSIMHVLKGKDVVVAPDLELQTLTEYRRARAVDGEARQP